LETISFDDDDDGVDMNSSCAAVSQILLSLEDALPSAARPGAAVHCENALLWNDGSQSTVDIGSLLTLDDNRFVGDRSSMTNDCREHVTDIAQGNSNSDETQYVERCGEGELAELQVSAELGVDHTYACVDNIDDNVTQSVDNSPSLLETTKLLQFVSPSRSTQEAGSTAGTAVMTADAATANTTTDAHVPDVDVELQAQVHTIQDTGLVDTSTGSGDVQTVSVAEVCSINDCHLACVSTLSSDDDQQVQLSASAAAADQAVAVCAAAVCSESVTQHEYVAVCADRRRSDLPVKADSRYISSVNCASLQVNVFLPFFDFHNT